jgi:glutaredoxin
LANPVLSFGSLAELRIRAPARWSTELPTPASFFKPEGIMAEQIIVYGVHNCEDTQRVRAHLGEHGISHAYIDLDATPDWSKVVMEWNGGKRITPTVVFGSDNARLAAPSNEELDAELRRRKLLPRSRRLQGHATSLREQLRRAS